MSRWDNEPWFEKSPLRLCRCGNPGVKLKWHEWSCERCLRIEAAHDVVVRPKLTEEQRKANKREGEIRRRKAKQVEKPAVPGPLGILIVGYGTYSF